MFTATSINSLKNELKKIDGRILSLQHELNALRTKLDDENRAYNKVLVKIGAIEAIKYSPVYKELDEVFNTESAICEIIFNYTYDFHYCLDHKRLHLEPRCFLCVMNSSEYEQYEFVFEEPVIIEIDYLNNRKRFEPTYFLDVNTFKVLSDRSLELQGDLKSCGSILKWHEKGYQTEPGTKLKLKYKRCYAGLLFTVSGFEPASKHYQQTLTNHYLELHKF